MSSSRNCFLWTWEEWKSFMRWGNSSNATQPYGNGTRTPRTPPNREREPLLEAERQKQAAVSKNIHENLTVSSPVEESDHEPMSRPKHVRNHPSFSVMPPSRGNTLDNAALGDISIPETSREGNRELMLSSGYVPNLDIPKPSSKATTLEEDTNVSPSSIHSTGSDRAARITSSSRAADAVLLGVGNKFIGDESHADDSDYHTDDEIAPNDKKLEDQLLDQIIEWPKGENRFFIPIDEQKRLVTPFSIATELRRVEEKDNRREDEELVEFANRVWAEAPKLFSILVCLGKGKCIYNFLKEGLNDDHLPFVRSQLQTNANGTVGGRIKLSSRKNAPKPIKSMTNWSRNEITGFVRDQWWMLAPVFKETKKVRHYDLDDMCVMPFIEDHERTNTITSGFSTVWAVRIHPAHQKLNATNPRNLNPLIALKKLNSSEERDFKLEVEMLKAFSKHKDRHLIRLLATYRLKNRYHLMFPHCKYNLRTYWESNAQPMFTSINVRWFLSQCKGIAHGLMTIHNYRTSGSENTENLSALSRNRHGSTLGVNPTSIPVKETERIYGRHGDIKPENILWSDETESDEDCSTADDLEQIGVLVIADFGLMDFHGERSRSMVAADVPASLTYAPPELRLKIPISRAYDIWSLGCVYLEFVTWLVSWNDELHRFPDARGLTGASGVNDDQYYTIIEEKGCTPRAIVRESVTEWMLDLHEKSRCSQFVHDFVDLISKHMLVAEQADRIHCGPLNNRLQEMCRRSRDDPSYLTEPKPYPPRQRNLVAQAIDSAGKSENTAFNSPTSPTATEGNLLPTKNQIPADLDTTTKSPRMRPANPASRPISIVRLRSPSPSRHRSPSPRPNSPRPSIFLSHADQEESLQGVSESGLSENSASDRQRVYESLKAFIDDEHMSNILPDLIHCQWEAPKALQVGGKGPSAERVENLVVVNGVEPYFEASTCAEYMEKEWGHIGSEVLRLIIDGLTEPNSPQITPRKYVEKLTFEPNSITLTCMPAILRLEKEGVIEALVWFCQAVRVASLPGTLGVSMSTCQLVHCESTDYNIAPNFVDQSEPRLAMKLVFNLESLLELPKTEHSCWHQLFEAGVVCPRPSRQRLIAEGVGVGLEISFRCLVSLAVVEIPVLVNGCLLLMGYSTALTPTGMANNCIQWHFEMSTEGQLNPYRLQDRASPCIKMDNLKMLQESRCFVGWCSSTKVNLGTRDLDNELNWSDGAKQTKTLHWTGISVGMQAVTSNPAQIGGNAAANFQFVINTARFSPPTNYSKMLKDTSMQVALVVDSGARRAWLVPKLNLVLHMAHAWARYYNIHNDRIPYADPSHDATRAELALEEFGDVVLRGEGEDAFKLRQLLLGLNINLLDAMGKIERSGKGSLFGYEAMDIVTEPPSGGIMKRIKIKSEGRTWLSIANMADAVVVCADLGPAISPATPNGRNSQCCIVPSGFDYLTASIYCLTLLVKKHHLTLDLAVKDDNIKQGSDHLWKVSLDLFKECTHEAESTETCWQRGHVFQLVQEGDWKRSIYKLFHDTKVPVSSPLITAPAGAVVFGKGRADHTPS